MAGGYRSRDPLGVVLLSSKYDKYYNRLHYSRASVLDGHHRASELARVFLFAPSTLGYQPYFCTYGILPK